MTFRCMRDWTGEIWLFLDQLELCVDGIRPPAAISLVMVLVSSWHSRKVKDNVSNFWNVLKILSCVCMFELFRANLQIHFWSHWHGIGISLKLCYDLVKPSIRWSVTGILRNKIHTKWNFLVEIDMTLQNCDNRFSFCKIWQHCSKRLSVLKN